MNKKFFRIALLCALLGTGAAVTSCTDYDQEIADLQDQVTALDKKVSDLQSAINAGSVITGVSTNAAGVTVTLSNGQTFNLTNGKDGANGESGTPGTPGAPGTNGENGKDGLTYVPNPETGTFFLNGEDTKISYLKAGSVTATLDEHGCLVIEGVEGAEAPIVLNLKGGLTALVYRPGQNEKHSAIFTEHLADETPLLSKNGLVSFKVFPANFDVKSAKFFFSDSYKSAENGPVHFQTASLENGILAVEFSMDSLDSWMTSLDVEYNGSVISSDYFRVPGAMHFHNDTITTNKYTGKSDTTFVQNKILAACTDLNGELFGHPFPGVDPVMTYSQEHDEVLLLGYEESIDASSFFTTAYYTEKYHYAELFENYFDVEYTIALTKPYERKNIFGMPEMFDPNKDKTLSISGNVLTVNKSEWPGKSALGNEGYVDITATVAGVEVATAKKVKVKVCGNKPQQPTEVVLETEVFALDTIKYSDILSANRIGNYSHSISVDTAIVVDLAKKTLDGVTPAAVKNFFEHADYEILAKTGVSLKDADTVTLGSSSSKDIKFAIGEEKVTFTFTDKVPANFEGVLLVTGYGYDDASNTKYTKTLSFPVVIVPGTLPAINYNPLLVKENVLTVEPLNKKVDLTKVILAEQNATLAAHYNFSYEVAQPTRGTAKVEGMELSINEAKDTTVTLNVKLTAKENEVTVLPVGNTTLRVKFSKAPATHMFAETTATIELASVVKGGVAEVSKDSLAAHMTLLSAAGDSLVYFKNEEIAEPELVTWEDAPWGQLGEVLCLNNNVYNYVTSEITYDMVNNNHNVIGADNTYSVKLVTVDSANEAEAWAAYQNYKLTMAYLDAKNNNNKLFVKEEGLSFKFIFSENSLAAAKNGALKYGEFKFAGEAIPAFNEDVKNAFGQTTDKLATVTKNTQELEAMTKSYVSWKINDGDGALEQDITVPVTVKAFKSDKEVATMTFNVVLKATVK